MDLLTPAQEFKSLAQMTNLSRVNYATDSTFYKKHLTISLFFSAGRLNTRSKF